MPRALRLLSLLAAFALSACSVQRMSDQAFQAQAKVTESTRSYALLKSLPPSMEKIAVAVYNFDDQTGQFKPNDKLTEYSSAVTKGGLAILNNALLGAGSKGWFTVVERGGLKNILQERQIIRAMRQQYQMPGGQRLPELPPMLYAGMLIEGGIIGYDTNTLTGGLAASYFGIGGNSEYRSDRVSVYLRAVNIQTGEVLLSVTSTKTIYSLALQGNVFKYLTTDRILQAETGFTVNEPVQLAVRQAIETSVYSMIMEGAQEGLWQFADAAAGRAALADYLLRKAADSEPAEESFRTPPPPAPIPAASLPPAPVAAVPQAAYHEQLNNTQVSNAPLPAATAPATETQDGSRLPIAPPAQANPPEPATAAAPEAMPPPTAEMQAAEPRGPDTAIARPSDPNAIVRYLGDSRYTTRPAPPVACRTVLPNGNCGDGQ